MIIMPLAPIASPPGIIGYAREQTAEPMRRVKQLKRPRYAAYPLGKENGAAITAASRKEENTEEKAVAALRRRTEIFQGFLNQLGALVSDPANWDEDCLMPTTRSQGTALDVLWAASEHIEMPHGDVYPDGKGGLRIEWSSSTTERSVSLVIHPSDERQDYIYFQQSSMRGDLQKEITSDLLVRRLLWLVGSMK